MKKSIRFVALLILGSTLSLSAMTGDQKSSGRPVKRVPTFEEEKLLQTAIENKNFKELRAVLDDKNIDPTAMQIVIGSSYGWGLLYSLLQYAVIVLCEKNIKAHHRKALEEIVKYLLEYPFDINDEFDIESGKDIHRVRILDLLEASNFDELVQVCKDKSGTVTTKVHDVAPDSSKSWFCKKICCCCVPRKTKSS